MRETLARWTLAHRARVHRVPGNDRRGGDLVAAVQMRILPHRSGDAFAAQIAHLCALAVDRGAGLVVFPEDCATGLLAMLPGFQRLAGTGPAAIPVADIFAFAGPYVERAYRATFSTLARRHHVTIVAGTALLPRDGRVYNLCHVFGPDGTLLGVQPKLHLFPYEAAWGIAAGDDLAAWDVPLGRLAAPVCMDATYFETFRVARSLGADLAAVPTADPDPGYNVWKKRRGAWARATENGLVIANACLFGTFAGITLTGRSAIYAPLAMSRDGSGVLAEAAAPDREGVAVAACDLAGLRAWREGHDRPVAPDLLRALGHAYKAAHTPAPPSGTGAGGPVV